MQIIRAAGFRPGAGQATAAEWLRADDSTDHVAIDIDIAVRQPLRDMRDGVVDARMDAERQRVPLPAMSSRS